MGKHGVGKMNENGEMFAETCVNNNLVIGGSVFPHKTIHKTTWVSPDHVTENQIDHICICISSEGPWKMSEQSSRCSLRSPSPGREIQAKAEETPPGQKPRSEIQHRIPQKCSSGEEVQGHPLKRKHRAATEEDGRMDNKRGVEHLKAAWSSTCEEALGRLLR